MYRGRLWTMRQFAGFGTAEETNERFRYLLDHGQTGLSTAFDMPTLMGHDSDSPRSLGEVGREGVAIDSLDDMETLFAGIPLGEVSTSMTINSPAAMLLAFYICVAEEQGVRARSAPRDDPDGHPQGVHRAEGVHLPARAEHAARHRHDRVLRARRCPSGTRSRSPATTSARPARTRAQELAFTLANGFTYVDWAIERGLDVDDFAPRLSFFFNAHLDFFEEIAKYRAARRIWARELRERYGARNPRSWLMRFHTQTAGVSLTAQQPEVNIVRTALEALAAVLGGTQSLHTNSFDEALALPTEDAVRIALRTQQVIAHETGVVNTIDPLGGSYYVEHLTNTLEAEAYEYFDRIEKLGGVVEAIKENFFQREIAEASFRYQSEVEAKQRIVVGVNRYELENEPPPEILRIDPALETEQIERVQALRAAARRECRERRAGAPEGGRRARGSEPDAPDHRSRPCLRDDGRDVRRPARGLGHLARDPSSDAVFVRTVLASEKSRLHSDVGEFAATKPEQTFGRKVTKALPYVAALVFVAGGIAFLIAYFGNTSNVNAPGTRPGKPVDASKTPPTVPVPKGAQTVAAKYVIATMTRQNLPLSWKLTHPELKNGYTRKEWLTRQHPGAVLPARKTSAARATRCSGRTRTTCCWTSTSSPSRT